MSALRIYNSPRLGLEHTISHIKWSKYKSYYIDKNSLLIPGGLILNPGISLATVYSSTPHFYFSLIEAKCFHRKGMWARAEKCDLCSRAVCCYFSIHCWLKSTTRDPWWLYFRSMQQAGCPTFFSLLNYYHPIRPTKNYSHKISTTSFSSCLMKLLRLSGSDCWRGREILTWQMFLSGRVIVALQAVFYHF